MPMVTHPNMAMVKIRQIYARRGHSYCIVALPTPLMEAFGWKPGQFLAVYPTTDGAIKYMHQDQLMPADFNRDRLPKASPLLPPKKGSVHERATRIDEEMEAANEKLTRMLSAQKDDPESDHQARAKGARGRRRGLGYLAPESRQPSRPRSQRGRGHGHQSRRRR